MRINGRNAHGFLGCALWGSKFIKEGTTDIFQEGLNDIKSLGFGIVKVKVNKPAEEYGVDTKTKDEIQGNTRFIDYKPSTTLRNLFDAGIPEKEAQDMMKIINMFHELYKPLLEQFHTVVLSIWSSDDESMSSPDKDTAFFKAFTEYLQSNFTNKTFVLQNWESDNKFFKDKDLLGNVVSPSEERIKEIVTWINARQKGVTEGRNVASSTRVFHAFEVNLVNDFKNDQFKNDPARKHKCALSEIVPKINVDLVSYSAYETVDQKYHKGGLEAFLDVIQSKMEPLQTRAQAYMDSVVKDDPRFTKRVFLGEFSIDNYEKTPVDKTSGVQTTRKGNQYRDEYLEAKLAEDKVTINAAAAWGCPFIIYWAIYENEFEIDSHQRGSPRRGLFLPSEFGKKPGYSDLVPQKDLTDYFKSALECRVLTIGRPYTGSITELLACPSGLISSYHKSLLTHALSDATIEKGTFDMIIVNECTKKDVNAGLNGLFELLSLPSGTRKPLILFPKPVDGALRTTTVDPPQGVKQLDTDLGNLYQLEQ
jgi:hypothetical protein